MDLKVNLDMIAEEVGQHMLNAKLILRSGDVDDIAEGVRALGAARGLCKTVLANIKGLGGEYDAEERRFSDNLHESRKLFQRYLEKFNFGLKLQVSRTEEGTSLRATLTPPSRGLRDVPYTPPTKEARMPDEKPAACSQEEIDYMRKLRAQGLTRAKIAEMVGRNENTVYRYTQDQKSKGNQGISPKAKLSLDQAREIRQLSKDGAMTKELAVAYQVSEGAIYQILNNMTYRE